MDNSKGDIQNGWLPEEIWVTIMFLYNIIDIIQIPFDEPQE